MAAKVGGIIEGMKNGKNKKKHPKEQTAKRGRGRPRTIPREEIIKKICEIIANSSKGLRAAIKQVNQELNLKIDPTYLYRWINEDLALCQLYARAREDQADVLFDEAIEISDDSSEDDIFIEADTKEGKSAKRVANNEFIQRSKLRVDTRKWAASKLKPKKYGDKLDINPTGPIEVRLTVVYEDKAV